MRKDHFFSCQPLSVDADRDRLCGDLQSILLIGKESGAGQTVSCPTKILPSMGTNASLAPAVVLSLTVEPCTFLRLFKGTHAVLWLEEVAVTAYRPTI